MSIIFGHLEHTELIGGFPINQVSYNEDQSLIMCRDYLSLLT